MPAMLAQIVRNKRDEITARKTAVPADRLQELLPISNGSFLRALDRPGTNLICEFKPKTPGAGVLRARLDVAAVLAAYERGATAISVLTDYKYFGGSLQLLADVVMHSTLPALCADFIIDPYQCYEARHAGAQAVLLMVKILSDDAFELLHSTINALGMTAVVEVQNEGELRRALNLHPQVILINNRDLETSQITPKTTLELASKIPSDITIISAGGYSCRSDIEMILPCCQNFLIGSALMTAKDLNEKLSELKGLIYSKR